MKQTDREIMEAVGRVGKFVQIICQDRKKNPSALIIGVTFGINGSTEYIISFTDYGNMGRGHFAREEFTILEAVDEVANANPNQ